MTSMQVAQTEKVLNILSKWLEDKPGRRVTLRHVDGRWRAALEENQPMGGATLLDALGQAATVASLVNDLGEEIVYE